MSTLNHFPLPQNAIALTKGYFQSLQNNICEALEILDGKQYFHEDRWTRPHGGGGITRILNNGSVFEKAGVNFSHVYGDALPTAATEHRHELKDYHFNALGLSLVIHPDNPMIPTAHANVRFFMAEKEGSEPIWWFGGGFDLTPYYGFTEDCKHWHTVAKNACIPFGDTLYPRFKQACDTYFYLKHRDEARGVGGLFFDDFNELGFEKSFELAQSIGNHFMLGYGPIVEKRKHLSYTEEEKRFQQYRRGRYVEFNLIYDRGTLFGLQSNGRTESILMSLPPDVSFKYNWQPKPGSKESLLYTDFLPIREWID